MAPKVSIIIAVGVPGAHLEECAAHCLNLEYRDFEIIVLPDSEWTPPDPRIKVIPTGKVRPAEKRDIGVKKALGEIAAIIDDDAYPALDWLSKAVPHFLDPTVAAVGGPGVTPPGDNPRKHMSGLIYESPLVSGHYTYRYKPGRLSDVDDYPTSNLILRRSDFLAAGGFNTGYWPGEDTILCLKLTHDLHKHIIYDPGVVVYHHRREVFIPHLRQIRSYALHRGFFTKKFPATSLRFSYFVPSLFTFFVFFGWTAGIAWHHLVTLWYAGLAVYAVLNLLYSMRARSVTGIAGVFAGTFLTHIVYGIWFLAGLVKSEIHD